MEVEKEIIMVEEGAHNRGTQVFDADGGIQVFDADGGIRRLRNDIQHYRHKDLMDLEKSQMQLSEMFMDLSIMIESQGEQIDRIEFSVENASEYVESAKKELTSAVGFKDAARKVRGRLLVEAILFQSYYIM